jgi:hypothetical protein
MKPIANLSDQGLEGFRQGEGHDQAKSAPRSSSLASDTGISISEFRRIVHDGAEG